jgi:methylated-DNA-protein-cysteine methyltransferase-like protein
VYALVKRIPKGKVSTYGRIAVLLDKPRAARAVGYALNALKKQEETEVPWQRVINASGKISFKGDVFRANLQRKLLEKEGIQFHTDGQIDLHTFGWPS